MKVIEYPEVVVHAEYHWWIAPLFYALVAVIVVTAFIVLRKHRRKGPPPLPRPEWTLL